MTSKDSTRTSADDTSFEFHASLLLNLDLENNARKSIDSVLKGRINIAQDSDWYSRVSILSQTIDRESKQQDQSGKIKHNRDGQPKTISAKGLAISGSRNGELDLAKFYALKNTGEYLKIQKQQLQSLQPDSDQVDITQYPEGSFCIRFNFTLASPYISKDDVEFYIIDNPIRKEWVFRVPYIAGSQWKGALHHAMTNSLVEEAAKLSPEDVITRRLALTRIFGTEKGLEADTSKAQTYLDSIMDDKASACFRKKLQEILLGINEDENEKKAPQVSGRLILHPTYFDRIGLEVINPHTDPKSPGVVRGINPIYFETVSKGSIGTFCLLYIPLTQCWGTELDDIKEDLRLIETGISDMMSRYGFGAKTSLGYGRSENSVMDGVLSSRLSNKCVEKSFDSLDSLTALDKTIEDEEA